MLKKIEDLLLWVYKRISNKFTSLYSKLKDWFPVLNKYPLLKYSMIPLILVLFIILRYIIKFVFNELAASISGFLGETSGFNISERTIVLGIAAFLIILRIGLKLMRPKKKENNQLELKNENTI